MPKKVCQWSVVSYHSHIGAKKTQFVGELYWGLYYCPKVKNVVEAEIEKWRIKNKFEIYHRNSGEKVIKVVYKDLHGKEALKKFKTQEKALKELIKENIRKMGYKPLLFVDY